MKKLSITKMSDTIISKRKKAKMTQVQLAEATGINRGMSSRLGSCDYTPSIDQLQAIAEVLHFEVVDLFEDDKPVVQKTVLDKKYNIAVAGTGYVGLSIATLLLQALTASFLLLFILSYFSSFLHQTNQSNIFSYTGPKFNQSPCFQPGQLILY